ncbi:DUF2157 domain-containing protein [Halomonas sp. CnH100-B]|uniref:DUF2157 domain-containing protein n=1 Tax=Halomonas sp. CnH100-B TaxID=2954490 RepID=UPI002097F5A4|nr:DUF2157 domain-containing protein [Halomonas sp. CnH100-B]
MTTNRRELVSLVERGVISPDQVAKAVSVAGLHPTPRAWAALLDRLLLWLGALALAFAVLFFVAYHWVAIGHWLRFGLVQAVLLVAVGVAVWRPANVWVSRVALTAAFVLLGVLLALVGQVYQTGADPWQLFFAWALLGLPWVWAARFSLLWLVWLGVGNLAIWLHASVWGWGVNGRFLAGESGLWGLWAANVAAQTVWEWGAQRRGWPGRWAIRVLALGSGLPITLLMMSWVAGFTFGVTPSALLYPVWLAALYGVYRWWRLDLLILAGGCVSIIVVLTLCIARLVMWEGQGEAGGLLIVAVTVFALGAAAVAWLKRLQREAIQ